MSFNVVDPFLKQNKKWEDLPPTREQQLQLQVCSSSWHWNRKPESVEKSTDHINLEKIATSCLQGRVLGKGHLSWTLLDKMYVYWKLNQTDSLSLIGEHNTRLGAFPLWKREKITSTLHQESAFEIFKWTFASSTKRKKNTNYIFILFYMWPECPRNISKKERKPWFSLRITPKHNMKLSEASKLHQDLAMENFRSRHSSQTESKL